MRIGVISDTHIPVFTRVLPVEVIESFSSCDLIVHAGDIVEASVLEELESIAETKAVHGNMDSYELKKYLPAYTVFEACGKKIGLTHGEGFGKNVLNSAKEKFNSKIDIIIFGHSHIPINKKIGKTLFFNPGSATDTLLKGRRTYGIIEITEKLIRGEIKEIKQAQ